MTNSIFDLIDELKSATGLIADDLSDSDRERITAAIGAPVVSESGTAWWPEYVIENARRALAD